MNSDLTKLAGEITPTVQTLLSDQKEYNPFLDNAYLEEGTFLLERFNKAKYTIEDQRLAFTKPLNESLRSINAFFKRFSEPITQADKELREKLASHRKVLEEQRIEQQIQAMEQEKEVPQDIAKKIGGVVVKKVWDFEVISEDEVPSQYKVISGPAVRAAIRSGVRKIPGIKIMRREVVSL